MDSNDQRYPEWWRRRMLLHRMYVHTWRGQTVARKWPRGRGPPVSAAQAKTQEDFKRLVQAAKEVWPIDQVGARLIASNSQYIYRDVISRALVGKLAEMTIENPEVWDVISIQAQLDSIGSDQGSLLARAPTQWVILINPDNQPVLIWDEIAQMPVWGDAPETAISELTGDVLAGPGSGSQAATLAASGVTAGSYTSADITVDAKGRITEATNGASSGGITELTGDGAAGPGSGSQVLTLADTGVTPGTYTFATVQTDSKGRIINIDSGIIPPIPTPTEVVLGWQSGRYYTAQNAGGAASISANRLFATPMPVPLVENIGNIGLVVQAAVALSEVTIGIYENDSGYPGALIATLGTISTATNGVKTQATPSTPIAGPYVWLALAASHTPSIQLIAANSNYTPTQVGAPSPTTSAGTSSGLSASYIYNSGILPDPYPAGAGYVNGTPAIWIGK